MAAALCSRQYVHVHYVCGCARASWAGMRAKCREYCCNAGGQQALLGGWACTLRRLPARSSQMPRRLTPPVQPLAWLFLAAGGIPPPWIQRADHPAPCPPKGATMKQAERPVGPGTSCSQGVLLPEKHSRSFYLSRRQAKATSGKPPYSSCEYRRLKAPFTARPVHWISTLPNSPPSKPYPLAASRPSRRLSFSRPSPSARALLALANCSALADKLYSSISHDSLVNTMILRESESNNMGRGAYDTTGTPKPSPTTTPPTK
ncbi:hypothetical protein GGP41_000934 [Bipolaris sorokiniana]|uniref:Uncharacterized protein n=1 Tax=Cochliobolus sativus TaxID=45130 RepID=A0A8H6DZD6_COCSA|nr:hypothetical protein GGP41_000934 [Bipolaris sorokiniana]